METSKLINYLRLNKNIRNVNPWRQEEKENIAIVANLTVNIKLLYSNINFE